MYDAVTDGMHVCRALDFRDARLIRSNVSQQVVERCSHVPQGCSQGLSRLLAISNFNNSFATYPFDLTTENPIVLVLLDLLKVGCDDLELQAGTSGVQD